MIQHQTGKCIGVFGFLFGHSFETHYLESKDMIEFSGDQHYHRSPHSAICPRCGTIVDTPPLDDDDSSDDDVHPMKPLSDRIPSLN